MITRAAVNELAELRPKPRALRALELGSELAQDRQTRYPQGLQWGQLPVSFHEDRVGRAVPYLEALHGAATAERARVAGAQRIGQISVRRRVMDEQVLPTRSLNEQRRIARVSHRGETVADVAERQLLLTMMDAEPEPRLCAAYAYWQATGAAAPSIPILEAALKSPDREVFDIAAHALANMGDAGVGRVRRYAGEPSDDQPQSPVHPLQPSMTVLIHGTFAKDADWYKPGSSFHIYLKNDVYDDLYSGSDFFFWSGRYSHSARVAAARKLVAWCNEHPTTTLRLVAHSHGANVVNLATTMGLPACTLIHLSPPVHSHYLPRMANVSSGRFFTIRSRIDLVVFIDGGKFDYRNTTVAPFERRRVVALEGHSESHEQDRWEDKNVPVLVRSVCT